MLTAEPIFRSSGMSFRAFQRTVRASVRTVTRARRGPISIGLADLWCLRIGRHPAEVFGAKAWIEALEESVR